DRGLLYGDGLFETLRIINGQPIAWERHLTRLYGGCERLLIAPPDPPQLAEWARALCMGVGAGVLKIIVTRGVGGRGYRPPPPSATTPTVILQRHPMPEYPPHFWEEGIGLRLCQTRLGQNSALAGLKHLNRLEQVLARAEWDDVAFPEGLMLDYAGNVIEGTMTNLFMVKGDILYTPKLDECGVAGIMRLRILEQAHAWSIPLYEDRLTLEQLAQADELFVTNSLVGIWPVNTFDQTCYGRGPLTSRLMAAIGSPDVVPPLP
ncbi:MAG: 4-amino-4-deoxychorismate lyase, partial [Halothiobacillaceae bacterium]